MSGRKTGRRAVRGRAVGRTDERLQTLARLKDSLARVEEEVRKRIEANRAVYAVASIPTEMHRIFRRLGALELVRDLITDYDFDAGARRKIESISRMLSVGKKKSLDLRDVDKDVAGAADKAFAPFREAVAVIGAVLAADKPCGAERVCAAQCFQLVDSGGFGAVALENARVVMDEAVALLRARGFEKLCYGDVILVNTIGRSAQVLASYMPAKDTLFIRANLRKSSRLAANPTLWSVLHELGHRLESKFLSKGQILAMERLFLRYERELESVPLPAVGSTILVSGKPEVVTRVRELEESGRGQSLVIFGTGKYGLTFRKARVAASMDSLFVSQYAASSASENFAEMFDAYLRGVLSVSQRRDFEEVLRA